MAWKEVVVVVVEEPPFLATMSGRHILVVSVFVLAECRIAYLLLSILPRRPAEAQEKMI